MHFKLEEFIKNNRKPRCARNDNLTVYNTQRNSSKPCTDHLGNRFGSYKEMALFHKVEPEIFYYRKNRAKLPLELCLSPKSLRGHRYAKSICCSYKGKKYSSLLLACELLGLNPEVVYLHRRKGMTAEEAIDYALEHRRKEWTDHLGNKFSSLYEMAEFHHLPRETVRFRLQRNNWPLKEALTTPVGKPRGKSANG